MRKFFTLIVVSLFAVCYANAGYVTKGDKTLYTFRSLSQIEGSGVTGSNGDYEVASDLEIAATDTLRVEDGDNVKLGADVTITICGYGDLAPANGAVFDRTSKRFLPQCVAFSSETADGEVRNVTFNYCGLKYVGSKNFTIYNCQFYRVNSYNGGQGAITLASSGNAVTVEKCRFEKCDIPAIGGAANFLCGLTFKDNYLSDCNMANTNKPFVNVTVAGDMPIVIEGNTVVGNKRTMVGGIGVSNMYNLSGENKVYIRNNDVRNCRYGVTGFGQMEMVVTGNTLIDNCYETNANNGGSGISFYDPYIKATYYASGNRIEGNLWGITVIGGKEANFGNVSVPETDPSYNPGGNIFSNNGNGGVKYDLYNNSSNTIYAQNNTWGVDEQTEEKIETVIFHKNDNASLGEVIFMPAKSSSGVSDVTVAENAYYDIAKDCVVLSEKTDANVFSVNGTLVKSVKNVKTIDMSGLDSGVYVVKTTKSSVKIVK